MWVSEIVFKFLANQKNPHMQILFRLNAIKIGNL